MITKVTSVGPPAVTSENSTRLGFLFYFKIKPWKHAQERQRELCQVCGQSEATEGIGLAMGWPGQCWLEAPHFAEALVWQSHRA